MELNKEYTIELGHLCPHLIESIFSLIPIKSLTKLKIVSKHWYNFITNLRISHPPTTSSGLAIFLREINHNPALHESIFIKLQDQTLGKDCTLYKSLVHNYSYLVDSCNGLFLYCTQDYDSWIYHVSSPVLDQCIRLPRGHEVSRLAYTRLAFDGVNKYIFRVICFFCEEVDVNGGTMSCKVFSSKTWLWREFQVRILNGNFLLEDGFFRGHCFRSSVFSKDRLYMIWSFCMLIYDGKNELLNLIPLPKNKSTRTSSGVYLSQLLWESEGCIHLCDPTDEGFCIWTYNEEEEDDYCYDKVDYGGFRWRFKKLVMIDLLKLQKLDENVKARVWTAIRPKAFNEDLQVLYFELPPGTIISYSFETQKWAEVWSFGEPGENYFMCNVYPFLFNSVNLLTLRKYFAN